MTNPQYLLLDAKWLEEEIEKSSIDWSKAHLLNSETLWFTDARANVLLEVKQHCREVDEAVAAEREACAEVVRKQIEICEKLSTNYPNVDFDFRMAGLQDVLDCILDRGS